MRSAAVCFGLMLVGFSERIQSQVQAGVAAGDRVRYWDAASQAMIHASLMRAGNDTLTFKLANDSVIHVVRAQITRLEVNTGRYRSAALGAVVGLGAGILVGSIGSAFSGHKDGICQCVNRSQNMSVGASLGGIVGVVAGAAIGFPRDEWKNVPLLSSGTAIFAVTGPRLRLTYEAKPGSTTAVGFLHSADSVSVVLRGDQTGAFTTVPRNAIRSSEVSVGTERHGRVGFLLGLFGGAVLGAGGSAIAQPRRPQGDDYRGLNIVATGVLGMLAGSVIGAIIGSEIKTEQWGEFALPAKRNPP